MLIKILSSTIKKQTQSKIIHKVRKNYRKFEPWKVGLLKGRSGKFCMSILSNDPVDDREDTLLLIPCLLLFLVFFLEELSLPPTQPCGVEIHAPITSNILASDQSPPPPSHHHLKKHSAEKI